MSDGYDDSEYKDTYVHTEPSAESRMPSPMGVIREAVRARKDQFTKAFNKKFGSSYNFSEIEEKISKPDEASVLEKRGEYRSFIQNNVEALEKFDKKTAEVEAALDVLKECKTRGITGPKAEMSFQSLENEVLKDSKRITRFFRPNKIDDKQAIYFKYLEKVKKSSDLKPEQKAFQARYEKENPEKSQGVKESVERESKDLYSAPTFVGERIFDSTQVGSSRNTMPSPVGGVKRGASNSGALER